VPRFNRGGSEKREREVVERRRGEGMEKVEGMTEERGRKEGMGNSDGGGNCARGIDATDHFVYIADGFEKNSTAVV